MEYLDTRSPAPFRDPSYLQLRRASRSGNDTRILASEIIISPSEARSEVPWRACTEETRSFAPFHDPLQTRRASRCNNVILDTRLRDCLESLAVGTRSLTPLHSSHGYEGRCSAENDIPVPVFEAVSLRDRLPLESRLESLDSDDKASRALP